MFLMILTIDQALELDEASKFMQEILPFVDIAFLGILDFKNILKYDVNMENDIELELEKDYIKNYVKTIQI